MYIGEQEAPETPSSAVQRPVRHGSGGEHFTAETDHLGDVVVVIENLA